MTASEMCIRRVFSGARHDFAGHRCGNRAVKDGLCKVHQPGYEAERRKATEERQKAKREADLLFRAKLGIPRLRGQGYIVLTPDQAGALRDVLRRARQELYDLAHSSGDPADEANMEGVAVTYRSVAAMLAKLADQ